MLTRDDLLEAARTCRAVYPGPTNQRLLKFSGKSYTGQKYVFGSKNRGYCRIIWNDNVVTVAFRGTREAIDWTYSNLRMFPSLLQNCGPFDERVLVHRGFQRTLLYPDFATGLSGFESIWSRLNELRLLDRPIYVVGHSLGGALAILFSAMLRNRLKDEPRRTVTFGSPAVGGRAFRKFYGDLNDRTFRIINGIDPVPFTPPFGFRHVGRQIWLASDGGTREVTLRQRLQLAYKATSLAELASWHSMVAYISALERLDVGFVPGSELEEHGMATISD